MANGSTVHMFVDAPIMPKSEKTFDVPGSDAASKFSMPSVSADSVQTTYSSGSTHTFEVTTLAREDEDEEDVRAARAARAEDAAPIPYSEFRKELGL